MSQAKEPQYAKKSPTNTLAAQVTAHTLAGNIDDALAAARELLARFPRAVKKQYELAPVIVTAVTDDLPQVKGCGV